MDKEHVIQLVKNYSEIIKNYFLIKNIILFGSYAKDLQNELSDIDVAVIMEKLPENILDSESLLHRLGWGIDLRIEPIIFEEGNDPSGILQEIYETGIVVYKAA